MWTLPYSNLQGLLPSCCKSAQLCWDDGEQPRTARDSSESKPRGKRLPASLLEQTKQTNKENKHQPSNHKSFKSFIFIFNWLPHRGLETHEERGKTAETKPTTQMSQWTVGQAEGCCLWQCSQFSAYAVLPCFLHQILLMTISFKRRENKRYHRKGQNVKQNTFFKHWFVQNDPLGSFLSISFMWN